MNIIEWINDTFEGGNEPVPKYIQFFTVGHVSFVIGVVIARSGLL